MATATRRKNASPAAERTPVVVVAAGRQIDISARDEVKKALALREDWQRLALDYAEAIDEVQAAMDFLGESMAKLRIFAAERGPDSEMPVESTNQQAIDAVERLRGEDGSHTDLLRNLAVQLTVPGQGWLVGLAPRPAPTEMDPEAVTAERWFIASIDELGEHAGGLAVEDPETGKRIQLHGADDVGEGQEPDFWGRIWRRSIRHASRASSSMRGILSSCEELLIIDRAFRGIGRSRAWTGQLVYLPSDISFGNTNPSTDMAGDGEALDDPFNQEWMDATTLPIQDEGTAAAVTGLTLRGPRRDQGSGIEVIKLTDESRAAGLQARADKLIERIARGLPVPPEYIFGLATATHWGAGQIQEQAFQQFMAPLAVLMVSGLSTAYFRPALRAAGLGADEAARYLVWYDASDLVTNVEQRENALKAHEQIIISDASARRALGFDDDDAPGAEEIQRRLIEAQLRRAAKDVLTPQIPTAGIPDAALADDDGGTAGVDVSVSAPASTDGSVTPAAVAASARPLGERLASIDNGLKARLEAALDGVVRDALRKVGNRLENRARKDARTASAVRDVPPESVAATLGPSKVAAIEDPTATIEAVVDGMRDRFLRWTERAQRQALAMVPNLEEGALAVLAAEQARDRTEAWAWLRQALIDVVNLRLYDPHPEAPAQGEHNADMTVPFDVVREAVARAGGAGREPVQGSIFARIPAILRSVGIGTGPLMRRALGDAGITTEGYEWEYGFFPRTHPFEPHRFLDGVQFENFDDDALASDGWPGPFYMPGDHAGCMCDAVPILIGGG